jgi:hypothetical protein
VKAGPPGPVEIDPPARRDRRQPVPVAQAASGGRQVEEPVWRYVVVPGASELRIARVLTGAGATVELYPQLDRYDLDIAVGDRHWDVDVKEHTTVEGLLRHLRRNPPTARYVVLPSSHQGQQHALTDALPSHQVRTEDSLIREVKNALLQSKRRTR